MISPEFRLAVACCRWCFSSDSGHEIARLSGQIDWDSFSHLILRHRVQGLVAHALAKNHISPPADVAAAISSAAALEAERNLRSATESLCLRDSFASAGISLLFVKGLTLSALAYGDPFLKTGVDIDVLVDESSLSATAELLRKLGYRLVCPDEESFSSLPDWHKRVKESDWVRAKDNLLLDLHTRLSDTPRLIPEVGMGSPRQEVEVGAGRLATLATPDLFAYLCVHGAWSAWYRLKWIADVAALVENAGGGDVRGLYAQARARHAGRAPAQALLLADRIGLLQLPADLRIELARDRLTRLLTKIAIGQLLHVDEPKERSVRTAVIRLAEPLLLEGWTAKLSEAARQADEILHRRS